VQRVAGGFHDISGAVAGPLGAVYFADEYGSRIYRWSAGSGLEQVSDSIPQPVALAFDRSGDLLVVSRHGNVYCYRPGQSEEDIQVLEPESGAPPANAQAWVPTSRWRDGHDWIQASTRQEPLFYLSPDGSVFIPAPRSFASLPQPGRRERGTIDLVRTFALAPVRTGKPYYAADEFGHTTWRFKGGPGGALVDPQLFAEEGEAAVATDVDGAVYICAGAILVHNAAGVQVDQIKVPERPSSLAIGGPDGRTLFITARTSLYLVRTEALGGAPETR
jgi:sugar lactone lactonase YvrE